ncbi:MAG: hypothetical protein AB7V42_06160 [Thermoleophilia bacterium]
MADIEGALRAARPEWPSPSSGAEARARAALGLTPAPRSPSSWLGRATRRGGARLLVGAALLVTGGAAVAATIVSTTSSGAPNPPGRAASLDFGAAESVGGPVGRDGPPVVAVGGDGSVTVAWSRQGGVVARTRAADGTWGSPALLSTPGRRAVAPRVVAGPDGTVTAIWRERTAATRVTQRFTLPGGAPAGSLTTLVRMRWAVLTRSMAPGGSWSPARRISALTAQVRDIEEPGLVALADGTVLASWDIGSSMYGRVRSRDGAWGATAGLGPDRGEAVDPSLVATRGRALLVWSNRIDAGAKRRYETRTAEFAGGAWQAAEPLPGAGANPPHARGAVNANGDALVMRMAGDSVDVATGMVVSERADGGDWTAPEPVGPRAGSIWGAAPLVGLDGEGRIAALLERGRLQRLRRGGAWTGLPDLVRSVSPFTSRLTADATGRLLLVGPGTGGGRDLVVRTLPAPGRAITVATGNADAPSIATSADGVTAVAWVDSPAHEVRVAVSASRGRGG